MTERPSYLSERISIQHGSKTPPLTPSRATSGGSDSFSRDAGRVEKVKDTTPSLPVPPLDRSKGPGPDEVVRIVPAGFPPKVKNKGGPSGGGTLQEMQSQPVVPILTKSSSSGSSTSAGTKKRDFFAPPRYIHQEEFYISNIRTYTSMQSCELSSYAPMMIINIVERRLTLVSLP